MSSDFDRAVEFAGCMVHHQPRWADGTEGRSWRLAHRRSDTWPCHETVRVLALIREVRADECDQAARDASPYLAHEAGGHTSTYSVRKWLLDRAEKHREAT